VGGRADGKPLARNCGLGRDNDEERASGLETKGAPVLH
jgi:hypothetical protein